MAFVHSKAYTYTDLAGGAWHTEALRGHHGVHGITVCIDHLTRAPQTLTNTTLPAVAHIGEAGGRVDVLMDSNNCGEREDMVNRIMQFLRWCL